MSGEQPTQVKVGWLELSDGERRQVVMDREEVKKVLVQGFRDDIDAAVKAAREQWEGETDPSTRPGFRQSADNADELEIDIKRFGGVRRAVVSKATGQTLRWTPVASDKDGLMPHETLGAVEGGWLPPVQLSADERETIAKEFAAFVQDRSKNGNKEEQATFSVLRFPRGDIENFSICRWAMACERARNTNEDNLAYTKWAPWERAYYAALEAYALTKGEAFIKAQGDMVSGQDGGWLAPEAWSTSFIDQIHPASALARLPITRIPMGTRVVHVPRLSANVAVNWYGENSALTATQAQFQQVSWTARPEMSAAA